MKIVTVNVPESYIDAIQRLVGEDGLYPSRSELIRCAVREFLLKELNMIKSMAKYADRNPEDPAIDFDEDNFVRVPTVKDNGNGEKVKEFKTYKILRKLEL